MLSRSIGSGIGIGELAERGGEQAEIGMAATKRSVVESATVRHVIGPLTESAEHLRRQAVLTNKTAPYEFGVEIESSCGGAHTSIGRGVDESTQEHGLLVFHGSVESFGGVVGCCAVLFHMITFVYFQDVTPIIVNTSFDKRSALTYRRSRQSST